MLRRVFFALVLLLSLPALSTPHYLGGEISWDCLPNGNYRFRVTLYDDCGQSNSGGYLPSLLLNTNSSPSQIQLYKSEELEITLPCHPDTAFSRIGCGTSQPANSGSTLIIRYTSDSLFPNGVALTGTVPLTGLVFTVNAWYRNVATNLQGLNALSLYLEAKLYPDTTGSVSPCFENSPRSLAAPQPVFYAGYPSLYYQPYLDPDHDELDVAWGSPATGINGLPIMTYAPNYSAASPLPNKFINPLNEEAELDPATGNFTFLSHTQGSFLFSQRAKAMRNGLPISEVVREFQLKVVQPNPSNLPPALIFDYQNVDDSIRRIDIVARPGDMVGFNLAALHYLPSQLPNGDPVTTTLTASGSQFGLHYTYPGTGCPYPPCATLSSVPPLSDTGEVGLYFFWPVVLEHAINPGGSWKGPDCHYDFHFRAMDNSCPLPGVRNLVCRVNIDLSWLLGIRDEHCLYLDSSGTVSLSWQPPLDSLGCFSHYRILRSNFPEGPFTLLDTLGSLSQATYTYAAANYTDAQGYYLVEAVAERWGYTFPLRVFMDRTPLQVAKFTACPDTTIYINLVSLTDGQPVAGWLVPGATGIDTSNLPMYLGLTWDIPGTYPLWIWLQDSCGISWVLAEILVHQPVVPGFIGDRYFCPGHAYAVTATGGSNYLWSTGQTTAQIWFPNLTHTIPIGVTMTDPQGCRTSTTLVIRKMQPYEDERICMVDVKEDQHLEVIWEKTPEVDIKGYIIQYSSMQQAGLWAPLDTMDFGSGGRVTDSLHDPGTTQYFYRLLTIDSCDALSSPSALAGQLHLKAAVDKGQVMLSWLPYQGLNYNKVFVLRSAAGNDFVLLDSVNVPGINYLDDAPPQGALAYMLQIRDTICQPDVQSIIDVIQSNVCTVSIIGIDDNDAELPVNIFYAQGSGVLTIELKAGLPAGLCMDIYSLTGQRIIHSNLSPVPRTTLSLQHLVPGMYFYSIGRGDQRLGGGKFIRD